MTFKTTFSGFAIATAIAATGLAASPAALAQAKEQFFPLLVYRTGAYAPNGTPWANGKQDYLARRTRAGRLQPEPPRPGELLRDAGFRRA